MPVSSASVIRTFQARVVYGDTDLPHLVKASPHRTRMSEMRTLAAAGIVRSNYGTPTRPAAAVVAIAERRDRARRLSEDDGSGV